MAENEDVPPVHDNPAESRYEVRHGDDLAFLEYSRQPYGTTIVHTEVPKSLEGHGYAAKLVKFALDEARLKGEKVVLICPFARAWVQRHPAYADLIQSTQSPQSPQ
ncbi:MAG TPA: GNAT family N-acetyltransferase [Gemmatimonadales bacterium]|jgi:hypothetical protein